MSKRAGQTEFLTKYLTKKIANGKPGKFRYSGMKKKSGHNSTANGIRSEEEILDHSRKTNEENNVFATHVAPEFLKIAKFISEKFGKDVFIIGLRSAYEQGVKPWRVTEDYDVYSPLSKEERDRLSEAVREKFGGSYQWTSFGTIYRLGDEEVDVNLANPIPDAELKKRARRITDNIYVVSLEDLIVMKLTSTRKKDRTDVGKILRNAKGRYSTSVLLKESERAGVAKDLVKLAKRYGVQIS